MSNCQQILPGVAEAMIKTSAEEVGTIRRHNEARDLLGFWLMESVDLTAIGASRCG